MAIIVKIKNKKQEKAVTDFLNDKEIELKTSLKKMRLSIKQLPRNHIRVL